MKLLDLFAGIGGFSLAAHWMGWETVAFVEKEDFCQKVLAKNFGAANARTSGKGIPILDDIFTTNYGTIKSVLGRRGIRDRRVDIVTGGFPCQPFSAAGKRKGRADERHLFPEMLRVIREVKPRWVVAENVRGLLSVESGSVFAEVVSSLESEGYEVITFCVPASAVEAPHRRDRLWIVAHNAPHAERDGQFGGQITRGNETPNGKQPTWTDTAADAERANRAARNTNGRASTTNREVSDWPYAEYGRGDVDVANSRGIVHRRRQCQHGNDGKRAIRPDVEADGYAVRGIAPRLDDGDSNADSDRSQGMRNEQHGSRPARLYGGQDAGWREHWYEAATRLCRVDDGISDRVHRLKALGNSIVPQIAYEIFRAIEAAESDLK
jgi:DNA (cytosine-5)-methyltransferase 1